MFLRFPWVLEMKNKKNSSLFLKTNENRYLFNKQLPYGLDCNLNGIWPAH